VSTVYVPADSAARSVGADQVAAAIELQAARRGCVVDIVRNGSREMTWLEPLVEVACPDGRVGYGPVAHGTSPACSTQASWPGAATSWATAAPSRSPGSPPRTA